MFQRKQRYRRARLSASLQRQRRAETAEGVFRARLAAGVAQTMRATSTMPGEMTAGCSAALSLFKHGVLQDGGTRLRDIGGHLGGIC